MVAMKIGDLLFDCCKTAPFSYHLVFSKFFVSGGVLSLLLVPDSLVAFAQKPKGRLSLKVTARSV